MAAKLYDIKLKVNRSLIFRVLLFLLRNKKKTG